MNDMELHLSRLVRDSHKATQMLGIMANKKLVGMRASFSLEAARNLRNAADILEKAVRKET